MVSRILQTDYFDGLHQLFPDIAEKDLDAQAAAYGFTLAAHPVSGPMEGFLLWRYLEECWLRKI